MELAKITSKGQITIPIQIRKTLDLKEAQMAFEGFAEEFGLKTEEDVVNLVKEVRGEIWEKKYANID